MDFARELKRLHDEGWDYRQIAKIACKYIRSYISAVEQGEQRLLQFAREFLVAKRTSVKAVTLR